MASPDSINTACNAVTTPSETALHSPAHAKAQPSSAAESSAGAEVPKEIEFPEGHALHRSTPQRSAIGTHPLIALEKDSKPPL